MKKYRRKILKTKQVRTKKWICNIIKKSIQKKVMQKWITIKTYEIEVWVKK